MSCDGWLTRDTTSSTSVMKVTTRRSERSQRLRPLLSSSIRESVSTRLNPDRGPRSLCSPRPRSDSTNGRVLDSATGRFPDLWTARKSDLCYATTNRQLAIQKLAERSDLLLVVGSENSSNTQALVRVGRNAGVPTFRIDDAEGIDDAWLEGVDVVGVTAGHQHQTSVSKM